MMRRLLVVLLLSTIAGATVGCRQPPPEEADIVVLVHGLGRTSASMLILEDRLEDAGYRVVNFGYPSTSEAIEDLVERLEIEVGECCAARRSEVNFVTHSMGGVLVRSYLETEGQGYRGRVVMLSPPSQGSELIDAFEDTPLLQFFVGPAGAALGTDSTGIANQLGPADFPLGIITGDRSLNPLASWLIPGPDDGKVSVDRARLAGADDFLLIPATHTFIMNREDVAEATISFLRTGRFTDAAR